jgi:hypothetical protein
MRERVFRIAAASGKSRYLIADAPLGHAFAESRDFAGDLQTRNVRDTRRRWIKAHALENVGAINTCGGNFYQNLSSKWFWRREILTCKDFWSAWLSYDDCFHGDSCSLSCQARLLRHLPQINRLLLLFINVSWVDPETPPKLFSRVLDTAFLLALFLPRP